jgi:hypothetical protein
MTALGHKQTFAAQSSCPLYPRKRTCALHQLMSALGRDAADVTGQGNCGSGTYFQHTLCEQKSISER